MRFVEYDDRRNYWITFATFLLLEFSLIRASFP